MSNKCKARVWDNGDKISCDEPSGGNDYCDQHAGFSWGDLTEMEKMVWAAAYAQFITSDDGRRQMDAVQNANLALKALRASRPIHIK